MSQRETVESMKAEAPKVWLISSRDIPMLHSLATILKRSWPILLSVVLTVLVIVAYNMGEVLEKHHRKLMENVHYGVAAFILFVSFYFIALLIRMVWTGMDDDSDQ